MIAQARNLIGRWYSIPLLLVMWQAAVASGLVQSRLLPGVGAVWDVLVNETANGALLYHAGVTVSRALTGFSLAAIIGIPFAAAMARSILVRNLFEPIFFVGYPVPKIALFPIFIYLFGIGSLSKVLLVFLECLYPIAITTQAGGRAVNRALVWSAANMGAARARIIWSVVVPATAPFAFAGFRVAMPIAMIVVIITEMISSADGLGYLVMYSLASFKTDRMLAIVIVIALVGVALDRLVVGLRNRLVFWDRLESYYAE